MEVTRRLFCAITDGDQSLTQGQLVFLQALSDSLWQAESSVDHHVETHGLHQLTTPRHFAVMEQWASLLDRPYHPTAKAKQGLSEAEYRAYMAEFNNPIQLRWVAIKTNRIITGAGVNENCAAPIQWLAGDEHGQALEREMAAKG